MLWRMLCTVLSHVGQVNGMSWDTCHRASAHTSTTYSCTAVGGGPGVAGCQVLLCTHFYRDSGAKHTTIIG